MAKIIYYKSPINDSEKIEVNIQFDTLRDALKHFGIENEPLMVKINGEYPEDLSLDFELEGYDTVEIHRPVNGGNSAGAKESLATIIQIGALAAAFFLTGGLAAAVLIGASLVSGALMKKSAEIKARSANSGEDIADSDTGSNSYSLTNIQNEARPLSTMPLAMGSHRSAPDLQTDAFTSVFGQESTSGEGNPVIHEFMPSGALAGGARNGATKRWADMPADFIEPGFPKYAIRIAPNFFNVSTPITSAEQTNVINTVKAEYLVYGNNLTANWDLFGSTYTPLVIYHSDPTDPMFGRYNLFYFLARVKYIESLGNNTYTEIMDAIYSGSSLVGNDENYFVSNTSGVGAPPKELIKVTTTIDFYYPNSIGSGDTLGVFMPKLKNYLLAINNNVLNSSNKNNTFPVEMQFKVTAITSITSEGVDYSTQVFNHGLGDLTITERKIGLTDVVDNLATMGPIFSPIERTGPDQFRWVIPQVDDIARDISYPFHTNVKTIERKQLKNISDDYVFPGLFDVPTWMFFEGKVGQNAFSMKLEGQIYGTGGGGFTTNTTQVILYYKTSSQSDNDWTPYAENAIIAIQNNNPKKFVIPIDIEVTLGSTEKLQIRLRKTTIDENDNGNNKVCQIFADKIRFYSSYNYMFANDYIRLANAPQNLEGVSVNALLSDSATTTRYSALVESKCWIYNFGTESWDWAHTRNPAWWWLYLAHGGFLNLEADGDLTYPYSPTIGWVNYPGHANSTEHIFGVGLTDDKIDVDKVKAWAQFCDEKGLTFDAIFKDDVSCSDALERIASAGRASCTYYSGLLSIIYEDQNQPAVGMYGMSDIIAGSFSIVYQVANSPGKVIGKFVNRENWESEQVEATVPFSEADNLQVAEVSLEGITDKSLAQRAVNILAARQFYQKRTYRWDVGIDGFISRRGDVVYLSHDSTQYGCSGRVVDFIIVDEKIKGIKTNSAYLDSSVEFVTVKNPQGTMTTLGCTIDGNNILFNDDQNMDFGSWFYDKGVLNPSSLFVNSQPHDFVFIAGAKETTGKMVRIATIEPKDDLTFTISAVDEDPAMWAREFDDVIPDESFDDSELVLKLTSLQYTDLGQGKLKIEWDGSDYIEIINDDSDLPIESNGAFSFSGGQVILELVSGAKYNLVVRPFKLGEAFKTVEEKIKVWLG